jgi:DDE superfamily endonuclease
VMAVKLRDHQVEAVDAIVRGLDVPPGGVVPREGLRAQVHMASEPGRRSWLPRLRCGWRRAGVCWSWSPSSSGHALIDRALYLTKDWAADDERRELTGVPDELVFATKPELAARMLARARAAGLPAPRTMPRPGARPALVTLATPSPAPRRRLPPPLESHHRSRHHMTTTAKITNYSCRDCRYRPTAPRADRGRHPR